MIEFESVCVSYDGQRNWAVRDVSLSIGKGETVALLGSSGSGKSTLLKCVNGLTRFDRGSVTVAGQSVATANKVELRRSIGYVFQSIGLFPHRTVRENVEAVPKLLGWDLAHRRARSDRLLGSVGLPAEQYGNRFPDELSGGQQQRVGFARALASDPEILLMDEPFGALDAVVREELQKEVIRITRSLKKTILFVTHDLFEALQIADRIGVMHNGTLEQIGTPTELLTRPATDFVRNLVEKPRKMVRLLNRSVDVDEAS